MIKKRNVLAGAVVAAALALVSVGAAQAAPTVVDPGPPTVTASPATIGVNGTSTITITPVEGPISLFVTTEGGTVDPAEPTVEDDTAVSTFTADRAGDFTVQVRDSEENTIGSVTITVEGPALTASPARVRVGQTSTVTATGVFAEGPVTFGVRREDGTGNGFEATLTPTQVTPAEGRASTSFVATEPGRYQVAVGNDTTAFATTVIEVVGVLPVTG